MAEGSGGNPSKNAGIIQSLTAIRRSGSIPSAELLVSALKASGRARDLQAGRTIHAATIESGAITNPFVSSSLVAMYAKCGRMGDATAVFQAMASPRGIVAWNALILGYAENRDAALALELYDRMDLAPNHVTDLAALKACAAIAEDEEGVMAADSWKLVKMRALERAMMIHSRARVRGGDLHIFLANALIDVYARCGSVIDARRVFDAIQHRSVVSWATMILRYAENGDGEQGLELFREMNRQGCARNHVVLLAALKACSSAADRDRGGDEIERKPHWLEIARSLHSEASAAGFDKLPVVANSLIDLYARCGSVEESRRVFDEMPRRCVVSWTGMIMGYARAGDGDRALELFDRMRQQHCQPNYVTILAAIKACAILAEKEAGSIETSGGGIRTIKARALKTARSLRSIAAQHREIFVANALIDLFARCGSLADAFQIFRGLAARDAVSWSSIILGCADNGDDGRALDLFASMLRRREILPNPVSFLAAIKACGNLGAIERGRSIEEAVASAGLAKNTIVANSLVGMYGRCGSTADAQRVFDSLPASSRDLVTWNALVDAYGRHGDAERAMAIFNAMGGSADRTLRPNSVTFLIVLSACCHGGLVDEGKRVLESMILEHGLVPSIKHYTCVIDLLGRANRLDEAVELAERLPLEADSVIWTSLMDASRRWRNERVAKRAFEAAAKLEKRSAAYVMLSGMAATTQEP